jgi:hypothetical protein
MPLIAKIVLLSGVGIESLWFNLTSYFVWNPRLFGGSNIAIQRGEGSKQPE